MILKRLLSGAACVLFAVLAVLLLTGNAGYLLFGTLGTWGFIMVGLSALVGKQQPEKPVILPWKPSQLLSDSELRAVREQLDASMARPMMVMPSYWDTWDSRVGMIERAARNGTISMATATERYGKMLDEYRAISQASVVKSPMNQLYTLSSEYGLPVETPVQKAVLPDLSVHPVGTYLNGQYRKPDGDIEVTEVDSDNEVSDDVPSLEESLDGYAPEGQADLSRDLKAYLHRQVTEARKTPWTASRKREWHVGPEWLAEVKKLRDKAGEPLYRPLQRVHTASDGTLYGYPVQVGESFGTPELTAI